MSNLAVLPIITPLIAGIILAFFPKKLQWVRPLSKLFILINLVIAGLLLWVVFTDGTVILETGDWKAPYGIVLVADNWRHSLYLQRILSQPPARSMHRALLQTGKNDSTFIRSFSS